METLFFQSELKCRFSSFLADRNVNREFYERVPEVQFDYRMVDTPSRKSDSPRESLAHQIRVELEYILGIKNGKLEFGILHDAEARLRSLSKAALLDELKTADDELTRLLGDSNIAIRQIEVPWSSDKQSILSLLEALHSHEILHTGWNLAIMDHLNMERYPALKELWGE
jgi:hypothetical protein